VIFNAAKMEYIRQKFHQQTDYDDDAAPKFYYTGANYLLAADIDMGDDVSWVALGKKNSKYGDTPFFSGTFYGNGHTLRIHIKDAEDNNQGLFWQIEKKAKVQDLHLSGIIQCTSSRIVGAIATENYGTIENCWVSADVSSDWQESMSTYNAKVGGFVGENHGTIKYCCMTGNVTNNDASVGAFVGCDYILSTPTGTLDNCTFYGTRYTTHDQDNLYVGDCSGTPTNCHDSFTDDELTTYLSGIDAAYDLYREAVQHPFTVTINNNGDGTVKADNTGARPGQTINLTVTYGVTRLKALTVKDADGNDITISGDATNGYTFTMPRRAVTVTASFGDNWIDDGHYATEFSTVSGSTITITTPAELARLAYLVVNNLDDGNGKTYLLANDLDMSEFKWTPIGNNSRHFFGTFDGQGYTISGINVSSDDVYTGLFGNIENGTVKNLKLANSQIVAHHYFVSYVGGITGTLQQGTIENCYVNSDVTLKVEGNEYQGTCGGIAGEISIGTIKGCYSAASITKSDDATYQCVGGIVGWAGGSQLNSKTSTLTMNVSQASIDQGTSNSDKRAYVCGNANYVVATHNYYIATGTSNHEGDVKAFAVTVSPDATLTDLGYTVDCGDGATSYATSGLDFIANDDCSQFKFGDQWYGTEGKNIRFTIPVILSRATLDDVTVNSTTATPDVNGYYYIPATATVTVSGTPLLTLSDTESNSELLEAFDGKTVNVKLARTFTNDGTQYSIYSSWFTICLPFDLAISGSAFGGAQAKTLIGTGFTNNTLTLTFGSNASTLSAGMPYIIRWRYDNGDIEEPKFTGVTINNQAANTTTLDYVDFMGSFSPVTLAANDKSLLYLSADNKLYYPSADVTVGSCRAYFALKDGITAGESTAGVRSFVLDFGDGETTSLNEELRVKNEEFATAQWYTLDGRKLSKVVMK